jgi:hypothetical protein
MHIATAFRGFSIPGLNLAEIGHSSLRNATRISLVEAAWLDTASMKVNVAKYTNFCAGTMRSPGVGPSIQDQHDKELYGQMRQAKS